MKDYSRVAVLISLVLLFVLLSFAGPGFNPFGGVAYLFDSPLLWILLAVFFLSRGGCCGRRRCGRKPTSTETAA